MKSNPLLLFLLCFLLLYTPGVNAQVISTIAGCGIPGNSGAGGAATAAKLGQPYGIISDAAGNLFIADHDNHVIWKVNTSGIIAVIAGNGYHAGAVYGGFGGDGGPATDAMLSGPSGIALDAGGNIYIADYYNNRIRKVNTSGVITTVAGSTPGYSGDGMPATDAHLNGPSGIAIDTSGNIFIADRNNNVIRKVNTSGIISTVAGIGGLSSFGYNGDNINATAALLCLPAAVAVDGAGNLFIADCSNNRVRKVNTSGIITTIAGNGTHGYSGDGAAATAAEMYLPSGVATDVYGNVYFSDADNNVIRKVNTSGIITTVIGNGYGSGTGSGGYSGDGGIATIAELFHPVGITIGIYSTIVFADADNGAVRLVTNLAGVNPLTGDKEQISLFPNPNNGGFTVKGSLSDFNDKDLSLLVIDATGKIVYKDVIPVQNGAINSKIALDNNLPDGVYILGIGSGNETYHTPFVVEK